MNRRDAKQLGLLSGDWGRVTSATLPDGTFEINPCEKREMKGRVQDMEGMRPGVVSISWHFDHWAYGSDDVTLDATKATHPERFVRPRPRPTALPEAVWINPPNSFPDAHEKGLPKTIGSQKPGAPSAHPRSGSPSPGCVPAGPGSVSPDTLTLPDSTAPQHPPSDTRGMPQKIPGVCGLAPPSGKTAREASPSYTNMRQAGVSNRLTRTVAACPAWGTEGTRDERRIVFASCFRTRNRVGLRDSDADILL